TTVLASFRQSLRDAGYVEGQNIAIEQHWANDQLDLLPSLATDLVRRRVAVIVAGGGPPSTLAAKSATPTIPIVIVAGSDAVALGLVASLNRPGGNVTGVSFITSELEAKRLGLLREIVPQAGALGYLSDARFQFQASRQLTDQVLQAARTLGVEMVVVA